MISASVKILHPIHSVLIGCHVLQLHTRQKLLSRWKLSQYCGLVAGPSVGMLILLKMAFVSIYVIVYLETYLQLELMQRVSCHLTVLFAGRIEVPIKNSFEKKSKLFNT